MKNSLSIIALVLAVLALGVSLFHPRFASSGRETSFERVIRTGTIRCGYGVWYPQMIKDARTGQLSGYDYDVVNELGKFLKLKVEWVEEINWGVAEEGLSTGRYDVACGSFWAFPSRAKAAVFSTPFVYHPLYAVVRSSLGGRLDGYAWLNDPRYRFTYIAGTVGELIADTKFPKAKRLDTLALSTDGDAMMSVAMGKADFTFSNWTTVMRYMEQNPGKVEVIPLALEITNGALLLPGDDPRMKFMMDKAIAYLVDSGFVAKTMARYMGYNPNAWMIPSAAYERSVPPP